MGQIPFKASELDAMSAGVPNRSLSDVKANSDMFGGGIERAASQFGSGITSLAESGLAYMDRDKDRKTAEHVAIVSAQTDLVTPNLNARLKARPDGSGAAQSAWDEQVAIIHKVAEEQFPGDAKGASAYVKQKYSEIGHLRNSNVAFEFTQRATYNKEQADSGLNAVYNKLRTDPSMYDEAVRQGHTLIDNSSAVPAADKATSKLLFSQNAANTRFEGRLQAAKTVDDVKAVEKELSGGDLPKRGLVAEGNIEVAGRPQVQNADGSVSTVRSISIGVDDKQVLIPTVVGGKVVSNEDAIAHYKKTGENLGTFDTEANATAYAKALHDSEAAGLWQARLSAEQFKTLTTRVDSAKKTFQIKTAAEISTTLSTLRTQLDDANTAPLAPEQLEGVRRKIEAGGSEISTAHMADFARLARDNELKTTTRGLPAYQIAALRDQAKGGPAQAYPNLPPEMSDHINKVSKMFPGVSAGYLGATATIEYGGNFRKDGKTDYGIRSDTSSATGVYQFIDATWDSTVSNPGVKAVLEANGFKNVGPETRKDPMASTIAAAALASQNKSILTAALHRDVSDSELYMAHFMGAGTAAKFISNYVTNRDGIAASVAAPGQADANRTIFYSKDGTPRTVAQVYDLFTTKFAASPSQVTYGDGRTYGKLYEGAQKAQTDNPVQYAAQNGTHAVVPLNQPGAWEARGQTSKDISTYYRIPDADNKPLNAATEVPQLKKELADGSAEDVATLLGNIGRMDKTNAGASAAAMDQLGEKHTALGVAAQLMQGSAPDMATATTVIRGQKQIDAKNTNALGDKSEASDAFNKTVGTSLNFLDPKAREAIQRAAEAHYVQTANAIEGKFDAKEFGKSVNAVIGGDGRVGEVNSVKTVLPKGVDEKTFNKAVDNLIAPDLISASVDGRGQPNGMAPVYSDGSPARANEVRYQGKFRYVGGDTYEVYMADNKRLITKTVDPQSGGAMPYRMRFDKTMVTEVAKRDRTSYFNFSNVKP